MNHIKINNIIFMQYSYIVIFIHEIYFAICYLKSFLKYFCTVMTDDPDFIQDAGIPVGSETHAGEDVPIYARGPMAHLLHGEIYSTVIC